MSAIQSPTIQAVGYLSVEFIDADSATTVKAGNSETVNITAPAGFLYEILTAQLTVATPGATSSGTHDFRVLSEIQDIEVIFGRSVHGSAVEYIHSIWGTADSARRPDNEAGEVLALRGLRFDSSNGIDVLYTNDTDVDQANDRIIRFWCRKIKVG